MTTESPSLRILIAEDSSADRLILESIVAQAGHQAIPVADGIEALDAFEAHRPDIVLLDVMMPNMGGLEAARKIRELYQDELVPILFLTSLTDNESLVECIEAGGNDFIPKPYNSVVLKSKIKAFARVREMHQTLTHQKQQIELNNQHLIQEQTVAKQVFDQIAHTGCLDDGYLNFYMSPLAVFNGDVIVADVSPSGSLIVLLGDFTGHGLPAAIGSMPLATTFYGMVRKGFSVSDIMAEINQKLHEILPVGFFCCATCIDINMQQRRLRYWNGGLPASFLYRKQGDGFEALASKNLPLGVLSSKEFRAQTERVALDTGDRLFLWSDGIFEARNSAGAMFGEDRLHQFIEQNKHSDDLFHAVLDEVQAHIGESEKDDDLSLVEIPIQDIQYENKRHQYEVQSSEKLADWTMDLSLDANTLRQFDPLPLVTSILNEISGLSPHRTILYTVVAELYSNALEHGILRLKSSLKSSPEGFVEYYETRRQSLAELDSGSVRFMIKHRESSDDKGKCGTLRLRVIDSGQGFGVGQDKLYEKADAGDAGQHNYFGRGLSLMNSVCDEVILRAPGNDVEVAFSWHEQDQ
ncbi:SpoIIE family protein phosphatase [Agaribacterium haliotis]|uniref:SpoIIE family protein phosphatase n=1 Tax=Agaribacterium haliotis TaxID=2013869 RepID=UPI000BB59701|nr:SpoIIE family protein phosphatase [Agaribacterium haliotis]